MYVCPHLELNQRPPHYKCGALPLSYKGHTKKMREAGFEPAHPEIVGLKSTALDHSAIRAHTILFTLFLFLLLLFYFYFYFFGEEHIHPHEIYKFSL